MAETSSSRQPSHDSYQLEDGVWVQGRALLINRDFDFGLALGVEDVGPAVAASARMRANAEAAAKVSARVSFDMASHLAGALKGDVFSRCSVRYFHVLFGVDQVRLQTVFEFRGSGVEKVAMDAREPHATFVVVSDRSSMLAEWLDGDGAAIAAASAEAVDGLLEGLALLQGARPGGAPDACPVQANYRLEGERWAASAEGRILLKPTHMSSTFVICNRAASPITGDRMQ